MGWAVLHPRGNQWCWTPTVVGPRNLHLDPGRQSSELCEGMRQDTGKQSYSATWWKVRGFALALPFLKRPSISKLNVAKQKAAGESNPREKRGQSGGLGTWNLPTKP